MWTLIKQWKKSKRFKPGAALYRVDDAVPIVVSGFLTQTNYVIVAGTNFAVDLGSQNKLRVR